MTEIKTTFANRTDGITAHDALTQTLGHEGQHGIDGLIRGHDPQDIIAEYGTELNAFQTQAAVAKGLGVNSAWPIWKVNWSAQGAGVKRTQGVISSATEAANLWCQSYCANKADHL